MDARSSPHLSRPSLYVHHRCLRRRSSPPYVAYDSQPSPLTSVSCATSAGARPSAALGVTSAGSCPPFVRRRHTVRSPPVTVSGTASVGARVDGGDLADTQRAGTVCPVLSHKRATVRFWHGFRECIARMHWTREVDRMDLAPAVVVQPVTSPFVHPFVEFSLLTGPIPGQRFGHN